MYLKVTIFAGTNVGIYFSGYAEKRKFNTHTYMTYNTSAAEGVLMQSLIGEKSTVLRLPLIAHSPLLRLSVAGDTTLPGGQVNSI